jgi:hypothetical protein
MNPQRKALPVPLLTCEHKVASAESMALIASSSAVGAFCLSEDETANSFSALTAGTALSSPGFAEASRTALRQCPRNDIPRVGRERLRRSHPTQRLLGVGAPASFEGAPGAEADEETRGGLRIASVEVEDEVG